MRAHLYENRCIQITLVYILVGVGSRRTERDVSTEGGAAAGTSLQIVGAHSAEHTTVTTHFQGGQDC